MDEKEFQNKLVNKRVICAGTIIGTIDKFIEFSNVLWDTVKDNKNLNKIIDKGVLNFLIYQYEWQHSYQVCHHRHYGKIYKKVIQRSHRQSVQNMRKAYLRLMHIS